MIGKKKKDLGEIARRQNIQSATNERKHSEKTRHIEEDHLFYFYFSSGE